MNKVSKDDLLKLINNFEQETWKYPQSDKLDEAIDYMYRISAEIKKTENINIEKTSRILSSYLGLMKYKFGFEGMIIKQTPELSELAELINNTPLGFSEDTINYFNNISSRYNMYLSNIKNLDYLNIEMSIENEGVYLALESLKSLITNEKYRQLIQETSINEILIDYVKLLNNKTTLKTCEKKYDELIKLIWQKSLSNGIGEEFKVLFSNISGGDLFEQANNLINRPNQNSCSMITSKFVGTYGSDTRKIGFIYPNTSNIIMACSNNLGSNVVGDGVTNKENGTSLITPEVLEHEGIKKAKLKGEDVFSNHSYNEVLVNGMPCGIVIIGLGENDLNIDYENAKALSECLNLPLYSIDLMSLKNEITDKDKMYVAFHSILSYYGISSSEISNIAKSNVDLSNIYSIIEKEKDNIFNMFIQLKSSNKLNKENMNLMMSNLLSSYDIGYDIQITNKSI